MPADDDFEEWRAGIMRDPMSADGAGCALVLASVGAMLLGCLLTGAVLYADKAIWRQSRGVAFLLALPSIGLGIAAFFLLAPVLYRRSRDSAGSRGTAGVDAAEPAAGAESAAAAPAMPQGVAEVEADDVDLARRLGLSAGVADQEELREVERDLARLVGAMNGAAGGATNLRAGRHRDTPIRVFDHMVMRRDGSRQAHTVVGYEVPSGHDMEMMLQLPGGIFAESNDGRGSKVLLLPAARWMYYLVPGHLQRGEQLVRFADSWLEIHAQTFSTPPEQAPAPPPDSAPPPDGR